MMSQEIERLNMTLRGKVEDISGYDNKLRALQLENDNLKNSQAGAESRLREEWVLQVKTYETNILQFKQEN